MDFNLQKLRYERLSRKISQEEMAKAIGVTRTTYYKKENGDIRITVDEFSKLLETMGISKNEAGLFFTRNVPIREQKAI
ncbi:helix-turn-helix transcriptional regulator [Rummeliibacillus sp. TYF-LIM-RU47]|uniref:helix-turn-helix domain-containing protein n=1 Tax=Rummeliibacillus sp. TYF-LIM-RU47 TaxID=2608406 RepID=UPI001239C119|nr:helix-turn-helix transcriptional regulator [Rummeliibacillus sp. TYF-LIM-RU47]